MEEDIKRISGLGYEENYFAMGSDGFKMLKNSKAGRCVFHDGTQCTIYENRPRGCKLYPIVFNEDSKSAVRDDLCPYSKEFSLSLKSRRELSEIYPKLLNERMERKASK